MRESECTVGGGGEGSGGGVMEAEGGGRRGVLFQPDEQMSRPNIFPFNSGWFSSHFVTVDTFRSTNVTIVN